MNIFILVSLRQQAEWLLWSQIRFMSPFLKTFHSSESDLKLLWPSGPKVLLFQVPSLISDWPWPFPHCAPAKVTSWVQPNSLAPQGPQLPLTSFKTLIKGLRIREDFCDCFVKWHLPVFLYPKILFNHLYMFIFCFPALEWMLLDFCYVFFCFSALFTTPVTVPCM